MERSDARDEEGGVKDDFEVSKQDSQENLNIINGNMEHKWVLVAGETLLLLL